MNGAPHHGSEAFVDAAQDEVFMAAALAVGRRGLGLTSPNPAVGALVVKEGVIIGQGWTRPGGRPHAETEALNLAGAKARGATLYVTLEPCSHHGKTGPCAQAIIEAGISRVVSALDDPDPRVHGGGHKMLVDAGVSVTRGVGATEALRANLGHILRVREGRPMVTLKIAKTPDGYVAGSRHDSRLTITGAAANAQVHVMRAMHDAIMVGIGTVEADDPLMSVRLPGVRNARPLRVILDTHLRLSPRSRIVETAEEFPTLVIAGEGADAGKASALLAHEGIEVARVGLDAQGHVDLALALQLLGSRAITRVFSEGGPRVAAQLVAQNLADEIYIYTGAKPLGREGIVAFDAATKAIMADPARYTHLPDGTCGSDKRAHYERVL